MVARVLEKQMLLPGVKRIEKHQPKKVLIVEDDIDCIIQVDQVLEGLNAEVSYALDANDAVTKISQTHYDLIILDWFLYGSTGGEALLAAIKKIRNSSKFEKHSLFGCSKIVTFSAEDEKKIDIPWSQFYDHVLHWQKPISSKIISEDLISKLGIEKK